MTEKKWHDLGIAEELKQTPLQEIKIDRQRIALSYNDGKFAAISGFCNHFGGPLGKGCLEGDYVVCPWHHWKFHRQQGTGQPGHETERVPQFELKIENDRLFVNIEPISKRHKTPHPPHPLARPVSETRAEGPIRVLGLSTTVMEQRYPRYSTSEALLQNALNSAAQDHGAETKLIKLNDLNFQACKGYYSKSAHACTWPCTITQMNPKDELTPVYEALVHWADVVLLATPIRWGSASALYFKMIERFNCIQNQITLNNKVLIQNKVAAFIITGGQDNVQGVAGQVLGFFAELGFNFPPFPYIAHSLGWSAENMERNVAYVQESPDLAKGAADLARRAIEMSQRLNSSQAIVGDHMERAGRKACVES